jgi:hypothetical protein
MSVEVTGDARTPGKEHADAFHPPDRSGVCCTGAIKGGSRKMMSVHRTAAAFVLLIALTTACGGDATESEEYRDLAAEVTELEAALAQADSDLAETRAALAVAETTAASSEDVLGLHAVPDGAVVVWGTAACDFAEGGTGLDGKPGMAIVCDLDMSDPRVSGSETQDRFGFLAGRLWVGGVWVAAEATITNDGGSWRGVAQGAEDDEAIPIGEAHYVGEGTYAGLEFHYYFFDSPEYEAVQIHGWISGGE